jgi:hypothetical protein
MPTPTKDQIKAAKPARERLATPAWGADSEVWVRGLSGRGRDLWDAGNFKRQAGQIVPKPEDRRARMAVLTCEDEAGLKLFSDEDVAWLTETDGDTLDRIYETAARLSFTSPAAAEEAEKN